METVQVTDEQIKQVWENMPAWERKSLEDEFGTLASAAMFYALAKQYGIYKHQVEKLSGNSLDSE